MGAKRPWLIESEAVSHPPAGLERRPAAVAVGGWVAVGGGGGAARVTSGSSGCPHMAQNRAFVAAVAPQDGQVIAGTPWPA